MYTFVSARAGKGSIRCANAGESYLYCLLLSMSFLKVSGTKIVDAGGKEMILRGAGLGGWMKFVLTNNLSSFSKLNHSSCLAWKISSLVHLLAYPFVPSFVR